MDAVVNFIEGFIAIFVAGGENLVGLITGILPTLSILLVSINALVGFIGEERVHNVARRGGNYSIVRYLILPLIGGFTMPNPGGLTLGRFLKEEHKPGYGDASAALGHPFTGLFPHVNPAELFVWLGIAQGIETLGLPTTELAIRYLIAGMILAFIRGNVTERVFIFMRNRKYKEETA